ncbi:hypothetical protein [Poseidonibacter ostreae]
MSTERTYIHWIKHCSNNSKSSFFSNIILI